MADGVDDGGGGIGFLRRLVAFQLPTGGSRFTIEAMSSAFPLAVLKEKTLPAF